MTETATITSNMSLSQAFRSVATRFGRRVALVTPDERLTYRQVLSQVEALAYHLRRLGVGKGDRIATLLWSVPEFVYLFFASACLGAVIVPLPPRIRRSQMEDFIREVEPCLVVTSSALEVQNGLEALEALKQEMPALRHVLVTDGGNGAGRTFSDMLRLPPGELLQDEATSPQDLLAILYTSGTTGRAKGIMHSHRGLIGPVVASIKLRAMWMSFFPTFRRMKRWLRMLVRYGARLVRAAGRQQVFLSTMAMHTISGLEAMLQGLLMGDRLVLLPRFHPVRVLETIERERVTVLIGVPLSYLTMLRVESFDRFRLNSLIICAMGAAPCPPTLAREIQDRFKCAVHIGFGMTELGGGIAATSIEDSPQSQAETVGKAMPGMEVRIVDDQHRSLPPGSIGELAVRSDTVMLGYYGDGKEHDRPVDEQGWLYTGDLAIMDRNDYIRIVGRKKDLIIRGGQNIYPVRIENLLSSMEGIREAAVVGIPDSYAGESVWAFVIPSDENSLTEKSILQYCRAHLEAYEIPQRVRIVEDFPRTSTHKPQKYHLRQLALEETQEHA